MGATKVDTRMVGGGVVFMLCEGISALGNVAKT